MTRNKLEQTNDVMSDAKKLAMSSKSRRKFHAIDFNCYQKRIRKLMDNSFSSRMITSISSFLWMCEYVTNAIVNMNKPHGVQWVGTSTRYSSLGSIHAFLAIDFDNYIVTAIIRNDTNTIHEEYSINCIQWISDIGSDL